MAPGAQRSQVGRTVRATLGLLDDVVDVHPSDRRPALHTAIAIALPALRPQGLPCGSGVVRVGALRWWRRPANGAVHGRPGGHRGDPPDTISEISSFVPCSRQGKQVETAPPLEGAVLAALAQATTL